MRTSASQFQLLVEFMERNGDLSKPTEGPQGRMTNVQLWSQLTNMLNADATGDTKTVDKWRKVWSDMKNNTKKKAARIHRHASGTGGGPSSRLELTELEQRVMNIIGPQAATGIIQVGEIGLDQDPPSRIEISEVEVQESTDAVPRKEILKGVNGRFTSGQLIAIMGPSGAGKSSLLNALSGYRSAGVEGELLVNGQPRDEHLFQRSSCYITQEDLLQPLLTVREAMYVAARLKAPKGGKMLAEKILEKFSLSDEQTIDTKTDMLSGGQKKRLSIALELVNNPPVFFLDEPTSGLDTVTSTQCVEVLKQIAREGRTVVCTIHQPAASLFEMFDQVYVMADGLCVYQGDTSAMVPFLESVGLPCPRHHNPADFIIEMTEHQEHIKLLCDEMKNGLAFKSAKVDETPKESINNQIELKICYENPDSQETQIILSNQKCSYKVSKFNGTSGSVSSSSSQIFTGDTSLEWMKMSDSREYATTYCEQFLILLQRMMKQLYRNRQGLSIQFIHHVMCGLLIGVCFWNMANDGAQMFNHLKLCVGLIIFFAYTQIMVPVLVYPQEVKLVKKEHFNCWYSLTPYYAALTVSKLPLQILFNIIFSTIVFFMVGIPFTVPRFSAFCLVGNVVSLAAEGMGMAIGSVFSVTNGCAIGPSAIAPFLGLGIYGFDFAHEIPLLMNLLMKTSFIRCGIVAMVLTIFGFNRQPLECKEMYCHFAKPDVLMKYLDIEHSSIWIEIGMIMAIMIVFRSMCYIGLRWRFAT